MSSSPLVRDVRAGPWLFAGLVAVVLGLLLAGLVKNTFHQPELVAGAGAVTYQTTDRTEGDPVRLSGHSQAAQTFTATQPNLYRIDVLFAGNGEAGSPALRASLWEDEGNTPLRTVDVPADTIRGDGFRAFEFAPVRDSAGRSFRVSIEVRDATLDGSVAVATSECDCYTKGTLFIDGESRPERDMVMAVSYQTQASSVYGELLRRMSQYKPEFFKGGALAAIILATIVLVLLAVASFTYLLPGPEWRMPLWAAAIIAAALILAPLLWLVVDYLMY